MHYSRQFGAVEPAHPPLFETQFRRVVLYVSVRRMVSLSAGRMMDDKGVIYRIRVVSKCASRLQFLCLRLARR